MLHARSAENREGFKIEFLKSDATCVPRFRSFNRYGLEKALVEDRVLAHRVFNKLHG